MYVYIDVCLYVYTYAPEAYECAHLRRLVSESLVSCAAQRENKANHYVQLNSISEDHWPSEKM